MKGKIISLILFAFVAVIPVTAQMRSVYARVVSSSDSSPVEFATVSLMQPDSVMISTDITDINGYFHFDISVSDGMFLNISSVGCKSIDVALPCDSVISLVNSTELAEVVVRASKRYVKGTPRGLQISMDGNPLSKLGNAMDAIRQLPLIDSSVGGISVLGHGVPVIYINNRLVQSVSELSMLSADEISDVEIITNPSSKYGADVTSVILITTRKRNDGFHVVAAGNISASEEWSETADLTLNYHTENGLTVFGDFSYGFSGFKQNRHYSEEFSTKSNADIVYKTDTYANAKSKSQSLMTDAGFNYDFGKNSVGIKYAFRRTPKSHYSGSANSTTEFRQNESMIESLSDLHRQHSMHHVNTFGSLSLPVNIGLRIDADYVRSLNKSNSGVEENNYINVVLNSNSNIASLWSGKLMLLRKFYNVEIEAGTDISYTHNKQYYIGFSTGNPDFIRPETDDVKQNLYAGFVSFDWTPNEKWNVYGGIRLEATNTDFMQNNIIREDLSKRYADWLPNLGISFNSPVNIIMYYRSSVIRPVYQSLDNTYLYVTPTLWETGNPELKSALTHKIGLNVNYKKFILQSSFAINRRDVSTVYLHDDGDHINIVRPVNLPDFNSFQLVAVQRLDLGLWHPTVQCVFYIQNLKYGTPKRAYKKPLYTLSLNNRFDIPGGIYAYFNLYGLGTGNQGVVYSRGTWQASLTLNKSWKNWTFTLSANDIFNTWRQRFDTNTNTVDYSSDIKGASRFLSLSIKYTLNTEKGKYKGKVSRQDEIDRL